MAVSTPSPRFRSVALAVAAALVLPISLTAQDHHTRHATERGEAHEAAAAGVAIPAPLGESRTGILVMAHGGTDAWNASVDAALAPVREEIPTALAFGMAARPTLAAALDSLRATGVERVAVVRMFLSGTSFRAQTDYLLGLSETPPHHFMHHDAEGGMLHGEHAAGLDTPPAIGTEGLTLTTHDAGLKAWPGVRRILADRVRALSTDPERERVLVLAHGMGDEADNQAVLDDMTRALAEIAAGDFAEVRPETLREDWEEARQAAEARIDTFMENAESAGHTVLVVPFRLSGFGPYEEVLEGWDYRAGQGLLPHPSLTDWVLEQAGSIACVQGWQHPALACPGSLVTEDPTAGN